MPAPLLNAVLICNKALVRLGADQISALSDGTPAANLCNLLYAPLRDELLSEHNWKFNKVFVQLNAAATGPLFRYTYSYLLPSDCLTVREVEADPWDVSEGSILCNDSGPINVVYSQQVTDETKWEMKFGDALSWRMSMELALSLTQSTSMYEEMEKGLKNSLALARAYSSIEASPQRLRADMWSGARKGYRYLFPMAVTSDPYNP